MNKQQELEYIAKYNIKRSIKEYKNTVDIYIKIREAKFKSLGFIIYDH